MTEQEKQQMIEERYEFLSCDLRDSVEGITQELKVRLYKIATADVEWFESHQPKPTEELREEIIDIITCTMESEDFCRQHCYSKDSTPIKEDCPECATKRILSLIQPKIDWDKVKQSQPFGKFSPEYHGFMAGVEACKKAVEG